MLIAIFVPFGYMNKSEKYWLNSIVFSTASRDLHFVERQNWL